MRAFNTAIRSGIPITVLALLPLSAHAVSIVPECAVRVSATPPGLDCILMTFGNVAQLILGLTGGVALLMFVYGGFLILSSAGMEDRVKTGKDIIKTAVIGIIIILTAGYLIRFGLSALEVQMEVDETAAYHQIIRQNI